MDSVRLWLLLPIAESWTKLLDLLFIIMRTSCQASKTKPSRLHLTNLLSRYKCLTKTMLIIRCFLSALRVVSTFSDLRIQVYMYGQQVNFVIFMFLNIPLGLAYQKLLHPKKASPTTRLACGLSWGLVIAWFCFGRYVVNCICKCNCVWYLKLRYEQYLHRILFFWFAIWINIHFNVLCLFWLNELLSGKHNNNQ